MHSLSNLRQSHLHFCKFARCAEFRETCYDQIIKQCSCLVLIDEHMRPVAIR